MSSKHEIRTASAPQPVGTYSQAIRDGNRVYISGQVGMDPKTSKLVSDGFEAQADQAFSNLRAVADASGVSLDAAVKVNIFITDVNNFA
ncbi:unnamed protein product, partial [Medioppia subpectinata]